MRNKKDVHLLEGLNYTRKWKISFHITVAFLVHKTFANIGGLQPISRDTGNNAAMYNCWWTNKRS